ncbi:NUDIX domain-containing protein [Streptomyces sp. NPDC057235]|uniref:NUDIX domain-containing protein n=1 Tax=Streptomyces sp. NPDC057235 TaxID=3346058 RepID=UPI003637CD1C
MARTEYYDDPKAPEPNSMVVAASGVVTDGRGRVLLQRRRDSGLWALPGGVMERGESLAVSDESTELRFVTPEEFAALPIHPTQRLRLRHFLENRPEPHLGRAP